MRVTKLKKLTACFMAALMIILMIPGTVLAYGGTMTFSEFLEAVEQGGGTFNGNGVSVQWEPDESVEVIHRVQEPNAQYQLFGELTDINISNVNFEYVPADIPNHSDGWSGLNKDWTAEQIRNAEFQFLNSGDVNIINCTFEKIIVSPFGNQNNRENDAKRILVIADSEFNNVYNAYAVKDIYPASAHITNCIFNYCSGGIYFEGSTPRKEIMILQNEFNDMDMYAAEGKENTRGLIQMSAACVLNDATKMQISRFTINGNTVKDGEITGDTGLPVMRLLCNAGNTVFLSWSPQDAFSIKVDAANATLPTMPSPITYDGLTKYTFMGWADKDSYKGANDTTNKDLFLKAGDVAEGGGKFYYAVWEKLYNVTYSDGVDNEEVFPDQKTIGVAYGEATPEFIGTPEREGYIFKGWSPEVSKTVTEGVIYTAIWEKADGTTNSETGTGTGIETDKPSDPDGTGSAVSPKTSDSTEPMFLAMVMIMGLGVMFAVGISVHKRKLNQGR